MRVAIGLDVAKRKRLSIGVERNNAVQRRAELTFSKDANIISKMLTN